MTATNHALPGTAIGLIVGEPLLAIPLAVLSHFVCDALPHFGVRNPNKAMRSKIFRNYLIVEAMVCAVIVMLLALLSPVHWQLAAICAFAAAAPDLLSYNRYISNVRRKPWKPGLYAKFAHDIQWFERPIGAVVEVSWAVALIIVLTPFFN